MIPGTRYNPDTDALEWTHSPAGITVSIYPGQVGVTIPTTEQDGTPTTAQWWGEPLPALRLAHAIRHAQTIDLHDSEDTLTPCRIHVAAAVEGVILTITSDSATHTVTVPSTETEALADAVFNAVAVATKSHPERDPAWYEISNALMEATRRLEHLGLNQGYLTALLR
jgi:hypothetical protein